MTGGTDISMEPTKNTSFMSESSAFYRFTVGRKLVIMQEKGEKDEPESHNVLGSELFSKNVNSYHDLMLF